ncbi:hypothetical protein J1N35_041856 [Gossypium stocksii]|uniref:Uncharacterized protein n=1 Tax=Gossypium stocksii TaxID=47602 RepID=A0A9D3UGQ6_9ROSI|nr:hypothetical protein J1N35_041856 [Gossypium stocksii]
MASVASTEPDWKCPGVVLRDQDDRLVWGLSGHGAAIWDPRLAEIYAIHKL